MQCLELKESFSVEWSDLHGEFATTYRPRGASVGEQGVKSPTTGAAGPVQVGLQSADVALRTALKAALMGSGRDDGDDIVGKIVKFIRKSQKILV